ncbi:leukocyte-associated immunoglobulin-like receptor 2 [Peromyscus maniculatus bairdii]|uniref:leukocyte-associated immunoglobulin-like receptor 2 n=1 Tax=Peromyscus maniculatus bairdii TaxID=230844 RepID=UPI003FCFD993
MFPLHSISILVLMICLGQPTRMQDGHLPRPYIFTEPGNVLPRGIPVVIMCKSPVGFDRFRLEKENLRIIDVINSSSSKTEARFYLGRVSKDTVGHYRCLYEVKNTWSPRSETLVLEVIHEDTTPASATITEVTPGSPLQSYKVWNGVRMALAGVILLVLGAIIGEACYSQQKSADSFRTPGGHNQGD